MDVGAPSESASEPRKEEENGETEEEGEKHQEICDGCALRFARVMQALERKESRLESKRHAANLVCDLLAERERLLNERLRRIEKREAKVADLEYLLDDCTAT